jgi:hypothetical protein
MDSHGLSSDPEVPCHMARLEHGRIFLPDSETIKALKSGFNLGRRLIMGASSETGPSFCPSDRVESFLTGLASERRTLRPC